MRNVPKLILLRHGQSDWNQKNRFTGWVDVPLSEAGIAEAKRAGDILSQKEIDVIFVSSLIRSQMTAMIAMTRHFSGKTPVFLHQGEERWEKWGTIYDKRSQVETIPVYAAWELNERMYGELQGLNKEEAARQFGKEQVQRWRRSYETCPPFGESLEMTANRSLPYFKKQVIPFLKEGKNVLIVAHGNSLRAIVMHLDSLSKEKIVTLEIPTGVPMSYVFLGEGMWKKET